MNLLENNEIISDDKAVAEIFNNYFANIKSSLDLEETGKNMASTNDIDDPVELATIKYTQALRGYQKNFILLKHFNFDLARQRI